MSQQKLIYRKFWKNTFGPRHAQKLQSILKMISEVEKRPSILDVGCGDGVVSQEIKQSLKAVVIGVDVSREYLLKASKKIDGTVMCNIETNLPFRDGVFDLCAQLDVIEHVANTDKLLSEAYRILRPSGYLIISTPNLASFFERIVLLLGFQPQNIEVSQYHKFGSAKRSPPVGHLKAFTVKALEETLEFHRFRIEKVTATTYLTGLMKYVDIALGKMRKSLGSLVIFLVRKK